MDKLTRNEARIGARTPRLKGTDSLESLDAAIVRMTEIIRDFDRTCRPWASWIEEPDEAA